MAVLAATERPPHTYDRTLAIATIALLLAGVFDVGRALYCRFRLSYAVTHSASVLSRRPLGATDGDALSFSADAAELVRRVSGLRDLPSSAVRAHRENSAPTDRSGLGLPRVTITARYTVPLLSPYVRALFPDGGVSIEAVGTRTNHAFAAPLSHADALRSAA